MILLSGADLVLPDRVVGSGSLVIEDDRIVSGCRRGVPARKRGCCCRREQIGADGSELAR